MKNSKLTILLLFVQLLAFSQKGHIELEELSPKLSTTEINEIINIVQKFTADKKLKSEVLKQKSTNSKPYYFGKEFDIINFPKIGIKVVVAPNKQTTVLAYPGFNTKLKDFDLKSKNITLNDVLNKHKHIKGYGCFANNLTNSVELHAYTDNSEYYHFIFQIPDGENLPRTLKADSKELKALLNSKLLRVESGTDVMPPSLPF
jgi:hypothetical protein